MASQSQDPSTPHQGNKKDTDLYKLVSPPQDQPLQTRAFKYLAGTRCVTDGHLERLLGANHYTMGRKVAAHLLNKC